MQTRGVVLACGVCLTAGMVVGLTIGRDGGPQDDPEQAGRSLGPTRRKRADPGASAAEDREPGALAGSRDRVERARPSFEDVRTRSRSASVNPAAPVGSAPAAEQDGSEVEEPEEELEQLRRELAELRDEQREVMGEPVERPTDMEPRFGGSAMSGAVQGALGQANVPGEVEGTDCSEHPCIVFGRLEGDEEDMEEVERAAALSVYDGDILTLLFWATSVEEPGATPAETGLFALAFYSFEDRASRGDELDRRIRARTMEYWNHDRPGRAASP
jgi:hypothetical protein